MGEARNLGARAERYNKPHPLPWELESFREHPARVPPMMRSYGVTAHYPILTIPTPRPIIKDAISTPHTELPRQAATARAREQWATASEHARARTSSDWAGQGHDKN